MYNNNFLAFLFLLTLSGAYGFYIITSGDDNFVRGRRGFSAQDASPRAVLMELPDEDDEDDFVFSPPGASQTLRNVEDLEYLDRAEQLRQAIEERRALLELADRYNQRLSPDDIGGIELVHEPQGFAGGFETDALPAYYEVPRKRSAIPVSYVIV